MVRKVGSGAGGAGGEGGVGGEGGAGWEGGERRSADSENTSGSVAGAVTLRASFLDARGGKFLFAFPRQRCGSRKRHGPSFMLPICLVLCFCPDRRGKMATDACMEESMDICTYIYICVSTCIHVHLL